MIQKSQSKWNCLLALGFMLKFIWYDYCGFCTFWCSVSHLIGILYVHIQPLQLCPTLCNPMDYNLPGSCVQRISQARILEWVVISYSRRSSWPSDQTHLLHARLNPSLASLALAGRFLSTAPPGKLLTVAQSLGHLPVLLVFYIVQEKYFFFLYLELHYYNHWSHIELRIWLNASSHLIIVIFARDPVTHLVIQEITGL